MARAVVCAISLSRQKKHPVHITYWTPEYICWTAGKPASRNQVISRSESPCTCVWGAFGQCEFAQRVASACCCFRQMQKTWGATLCE